MRFKKQFRIRGLLILVVVAALASLGVVRYLESQPIGIDWKPYTIERHEEAQRNGQATLVFLGADWDLGAAWAERTLSENVEITRFLKAKGVVALKIDTTDSQLAWKDAANRSFLKTLDDNWMAYHRVLILSSRPENPPIELPQHLSAKDVIKAVQSIERMESKSQ